MNQRELIKLIIQFHKLFLDQIRFDEKILIPSKIKFNTE